MTDRNIQEIKVKSFFKDDSFRQIVLYSGRSRMDLVPSNIDNLEPYSINESEKVNYCERLTYCIAKAISKCKEERRKPFQTILILTYLKCIPTNEVKETIGYKPSQFWKLKRQAQQEFAMYFNHYKDKYDIDKTFKLI